jgi:alanyl-tRNA synthetase
VLLEIDMGDRMRKIQNHTGEHIISGLAHSLFGAENVGFHADADSVTIDLNVKLTVGDIARLERLANPTTEDLLKDILAEIRKS